LHIIEGTRFDEIQKVLITIYRSNLLDSDKRKQLLKYIIKHSNKNLFINDDQNDLLDLCQTHMDESAQREKTDLTAKLFQALMHESKWKTVSLLKAILEQEANGEESDQ